MTEPDIGSARVNRGEGRKVKIGTTSNLKNRLRAISRMHNPAHVVATEPRSYELERKRHREFRAARITHSEWFTLTPQIENHIQEVVELYGHPECPCTSSGGYACR